MLVFGTARGVAWLLAAAGLTMLPIAANAQPSAPLEPSAPLDPMDNLGVDWPDLGQPDPVPSEPEPGVAAGQTAEPVGDSASVVAYTVQVSGIDDTDLLARFRSQSTLEANRKKGGNAAQIDRRARDDARLLVELLRADGYYDAAVEPRVDAAGPAVRVALEAAPGALYRFQSVELPGLEAAGEDAAKLRDSFAVKSGDPVDAAAVEAAGVTLKVKLGETGFARAAIGQQDIEVDHEQRVARLVLPVDPGPVQHFGELRVTGNPPLGARHVSRIARFERGERFRQSRLDDLRRALIATGLVATAETRLVPSADGRTVDVDVRLSPAPMRTVAGEVGYGTGEGFRAEASWQHRNFFSPEGAVTFRAVGGTQEQSLSGHLRRSNWRQRDQVLTAQIAASHVDRKAFDARTFTIGAGIERQSNFIWQKKWTWSAGTELIASDERDRSSGTEKRRTFKIAALPLTLGYDGTDSLLDPTKGFRLSGRLSPELSLRGGTFTYARAQIDGSAYRPVSDSVVVAGRIRLGTIVGATRDAIAPSRRFYAGGGGSVRGYGYQQLGPRDSDNDPIGGRSLAEFSLETRIRFGDFGVVPFIDGGSLSTRPLPRFSGLRFGAGIGGRYYTSFGPIRLDVGTPLDRRKGDSLVAVVVSLGQAF